MTFSFEFGYVYARAALIKLNDNAKPGEYTKIVSRLRQNNNHIYFPIPKKFQNANGSLNTEKVLKFAQNSLQPFEIFKYGMPNIQITHRSNPYSNPVFRRYLPHVRIVPTWNILDYLDDFEIFFGKDQYYLFDILIRDTFGTRGETYEKDTTVFIYTTDDSSKHSDEQIVAHEVGHQFLYPARPAHRGVYGGGFYEEYYNRDERHKQSWGPIMGAELVTLGQPGLLQWSDGFYAKGNFTEYDDIRKIAENNIGFSDTDGFVKRPPKRWELLSPTIVRQETNKFDFTRQFPWQDGEDCFPKYDVKNAFYRVHREDFYGIIGYPYDYDIIKMCLPKGSYTITVDSRLDGNKSSTLVPRIDLLYCNIEKNKNKDNITSLDGYYNEGTDPTILAMNAGHEQIYQGANNLFKSFGIIKVHNNKKYIQNPHNAADSGASYYTDEISINLNYTTLVYLRICGDYLNPVDPTTQKATVKVFEGASAYGSVGRYRLYNSLDPNAISEDIYDLLYQNCVPEHYKYNDCQDIYLFAPDDKDVEAQDKLNYQDEFIHLLSAEYNGEEQSIVINGKLSPKKRKFLVYGPAIDIDAEEKEGKFYIPVLINGVFKKQEFIVGQGLSDEPL